MSVFAGNGLEGKLFLGWRGVRRRGLLSVCGMTHALCPRIPPQPPGGCRKASEDRRGPDLTFLVKHPDILLFTPLLGELLQISFVLSPALRFHGRSSGRPPLCRLSPRRKQFRASLSFPFGVGRSGRSRIAGLLQLPYTAVPPARSQFLRSASMNRFTISF